MLPDLIITSWLDAPKYLRAKNDRISCAISITDPGVRAPSGFRAVEKKLRLQFIDVRDEGGMGSPPELLHVKQIVQFTEHIARANGKTLIHCHAGISRSTAAGFIVLAKILGPGNELEALDHILALRSIAYPNQPMIRMADALLERDGAMHAALVERNVSRL